MKLLHLITIAAQVALLCLILWACNLVVAYTGIPVPGSVLGLGIMAALLIGKLVPEKVVALGSAWLLADMLLFFIPPVVSVLKYRSLLSQSGSSIMALLVLGTLIVMSGTALVVDSVFAYEHRRNQEKRHA